MPKKKKRGGGPKTPEGKAVVRLNPVRHGVLGGLVWGAGDPAGGAGGGLAGTAGTG